MPFTETDGKKGKKVPGKQWDLKKSGIWEKLKNRRKYALCSIDKSFSGGGILD